MNPASEIPFGAPMARDDRRFTGLSWFCACSSIFLLGLYLLLGLHIRLRLGHWPTPMFENYSAPLFQAHFEILRLFLLATWFVAGPVWLLCLLVRPLRPHPPRIIAWQLATFAAGWLLIFAVILFDPTTFSAWFLD
jgi:hypothetical protein